jgi:hypothetical protein
LEAILRQRGAPDGLAGAERIERLRAHVLAHAPEASGEIDGVARTFLPELAHYGELIASSDGATVGMLTRGEDAGFSARIARLLHAWDMPQETIAAAAHVAHAFEHKRAFLKLEWRTGTHGVERAAAVYYRRRPNVEQALAILRPHARDLPLPYFRELAQLLGKDSVHFVCVSARPGLPPFSKMYFSQYLIPETYDAVRVRLARALQRFAPQPAAIARWAAYHDRLAPAHREQTLFVSLALTPHGLDPSIKIDYPDVAADVAVGVLNPENQPRVAAAFARLCARAGRRALSFLGVRLGHALEPVLKGYADFP